MNFKNAIHNLPPALLIQKTLEKKLGKLTDNGALAINTGKFTGRSPDDRFIVKDDLTTETVNWGKFNIPLSEENFDKLLDQTLEYAQQLEQTYSRDAYACASSRYRLNLRVITEFPWQNLFANNMFLRPTKEELVNFQHSWTILAFPGVKAQPQIHGTRQENYAAINFKKKIILIGGTGYTGEIKKGIFSVLNYILPIERNVLSMHCSANVGKNGDTALFFGLSGTGKTTLSNDPNRRLIGDDEHGWSSSNIYNLEGGCYAKTIDLSEVKEPMIYKAIKFGALLENIGFEDDDVTPNYEDASITQNTRVSYPIHHIDNIMYNSRGDIPKNIFFLTCDAFGVLPPISKLTKEQAMYHFLSGYTAKIAGTEAGITEPQATFSACFGAPFLPLHPMKYAKMLGQKLDEGCIIGDGKINVWLINTGWTGGSYGVGRRIDLVHTRALISAVLDGDLHNIHFRNDNIFELSIPEKCPGVPSSILNPRETWANKSEYDSKASMVKQLFDANFVKFS
jgi:phosphoenolpyruvate carboxykinase (ATP)